METPKLIYAAIAAMVGEIGVISKDKRNTQGTGYNYRGIDDVMNALNPLLAKHQVFIVPEALEKTREERASRSGGNLIFTSITMRYTFYAVDGSSVSAVVVGEGMDSGDKSTNKAMAVAMKYAMFQVFCIPTEEMAEPDAGTPEPSTPNPATPKPSAPEPKAEFNTPTASPKAMIEDFCIENQISREMYDTLVNRMISENSISGDRPTSVLKMQARLDAVKAEIIRIK